MCKLLSLLSIILLLSMTTILAQPNSEVRLVITEPVDCANNIMFIDIEVRAASLADTFRVGPQSYRFSFDDDLVGDPKIETELELSGLVTDVTNTVSFYNTHTLTGSIDTVVSYNVEHSGPVGVGYLLTTDWLSIGRLSFDILDMEGCFGFPIHKDPTFPPTSVAVIVPSGLIESTVNPIDLYGCIEELCPVSTEENYQKADWKVFPNPANDRVNIELEQNEFGGKVVKIDIMDVFGKLVYTEILTNNSFSTASLLPGIYMVQLKADNWQSSVQKLVKGTRKK